jgi:hypothetical protein
MSSAYTRCYQGLSELEYPLHDRTITVTSCGRICMGSRKINISVVFAGQNVGIREIAEHIWVVSFMHYDLGFFDDEPGRVECAPTPLLPRCYGAWDCVANTLHRSSGPNQVWSWDITWLPTTVRGLYLHLYLMMDVWSRRIVGWRIAESD